jgi:hypothetical protein
MMALARIAQDDAMGAEPYLAALRPVAGGDPLAVAHFGAAFFAEVDRRAGAPDADLPPIKTVVARAPAGPCVFIACDPVYFETYGWPFVRSFARHRPAAFLHIHMFDLPAADEAAFAARLDAVLGGVSYGLTTEATGLAGRKPEAPNYYHAVRFIRAATLDRLSAHPLVLMDVDLLFNRSPDLLFACFAEADGAVPVEAGRVEVSNQINASMVGIAPTPGGRAYLARVAAYIAACRAALVWGIDQVALFAVLTERTAHGVAPRLAAVPPALLDDDFGDGTVLWPGKCSPDHAAYARYKGMLSALNDELRD